VILASPYREVELVSSHDHASWTRLDFQVELSIATLPTQRQILHTTRDGYRAWLLSSLSQLSPVRWPTRPRSRSSSLLDHHYKAQRPPISSHVLLPLHPLQSCQCKSRPKIQSLFLFSLFVQQIYTSNARTPGTKQRPLFLL
jgi:hypothetical protein